MAHAPAGLGRPTDAETNPALSDRELLQRFVAHRDEAAFAALVERHGRTVWGACRRVLRHEQDAEDAFQATFLVLARKAASVNEGGAVGSWLYGVAYRIAMSARRSSARRHQHEQHATGARPGPPPLDEAACRELQGLLDAEVQRLAAKYRSPFILCCLEGMSRAEAARELGWKEGTVAGRLAEARRLLQVRLARRGVTLSAVLTGAALVQNQAAPHALIHATVQAVLAPLAGKAAAASLSPSAVALAEGLVKTMAAAKLKAALALVLAVTVLAAGAGVAARQLAVNPGPTAPPAAPAALAAPDEPEVFQPRPAPLVTPLDEQVLALAFSPDGTRLVTAGGRPGRPGQLKAWDVASGKAVATVKGIPGVRTVAFSPDGKSIATGDCAGFLRLRDPRSGEELAAVKAHGAGVNGVAFSPDGASLATAGLDHVVKLWDARTLHERKVFLGHQDMVFSVAFSHDGRALVSSGKEKVARVWDVATGKERVQLRGHEDGVEAVAASPDGRTVATAGWDGTVRLWDAETGKGTAVFSGNKSSLLAVAFSPDGERLAGACGDGKVRLWDVKARRAVATLRGHGAAVWALAFSGDGKYLASGGSDRTARLWDAATAQESATLLAGSPAGKAVRALACAPDGRAVALATDDNAVQLRDARTGDVLRVLPGHAEPVTCLAFAPDGRTLASGSTDRTIKLWDPATGTAERTLHGHTAGVAALAFTPDGKRLGSAGQDGAVRLWDPVSGRGLAALGGHDGPVEALAFAPDGHTLASGGEDGTVKLWAPDVTSDARTLKGHAGAVRALAFAPDGTLATGGDDGTVKVWDAAGGTERRAFRDDAAGVVALAFAPDGRTLVSGGQDGTLRVYGPSGPGCRQVLSGHAGAVNALAFLPGGGELLSGGADARVLRWLEGPSALPPVTVRGDGAGNRFAVFSPRGDWMASGGAGGSVTLWSRSLAPAQEPFASRPGRYADAAFAPDGRSVALANNTDLQLCDPASGDVLRAMPVGQTIRSVAFSPDGKYLAAGTGAWARQDDPSETLLFDASTGQELARLQGHAGLTYQVRFAPDGKTLATTSKDGTVRLWDVPSGKPRATLRGHTRPARGMAFLPDGTLVTAGWDRTLRFWDVGAGRELKAWDLGMPAGSLALSPDASLLAAAEVHWASKGPAPLKVWELGTGKVRLTLRGHHSRINGLAFTADGRGLLAVGNDGPAGEILLWDLDTGRLRCRLPTGQAENLTLSGDGRRAVVASPSGLYLWDLEFVHRERTWTAHAGKVSCGLFVKEGTLLATGGEDGTLKFWDVGKGEAVATLTGHRGGVRSLALLPDGRTLASAGDDRAVRLWDLASFTERAAFIGHALPVSSLAASPDGKTLASGGGDLNRPTGPGEVIVWDLEAGRPREALRGVEGAVRSLAYSPDGKLLAAGIAPDLVRVWDGRTGQPRTTLPAPFIGPVTFADGGALLVGGRGAGPGAEPGPSAVSRWETATWHKRPDLDGHRGRVYGVSLEADGRVLASASGDGTIKLWPAPSPAGGVGPASPAQVPVVIGSPAPAAPPTGRPGTVQGVAASAAPDEPDVPANGGPGKGWLAAAVLVGLLLVLSLAVCAYARQARRAAARPTEGSGQAKPSPPGATVAPVTFACSGCGKHLRAPASLAGKRVKCPRCGGTVVVGGTGVRAGAPGGKGASAPDPAKQ